MRLTNEAAVAPTTPLARPAGAVRFSRANATWAAGITLLAFAARLYHIAAMPYWLDELFTVRRAQLPLPKLVADSLAAHHFPTYFMLVAPLTHWSTAEAVLRMPSAVFGALAAGLAFAIGVAAGSRRAGIVAGVLMALAPLQVQYGQEARSYAMTSALVLLGLWGAVRLAAAAERGAPADAAYPRRAWLSYVLGTAGALDVLSVALPWYFAAQAAFLRIGRRAGDGFRRDAWRAQLAIAALFLPALAALLLFPHGSFERGFAWVPPLSETLWPSAAAVYLFRSSNVLTLQVFPEAVPGFGLALVGLATFGMWRLRRRPRLLAVLGLALVALPVALLVASIFKSVLMPRYLLWSAAPFFVFVGLGVDALSRPVRASTAAFICGLAALSLIPYYGSETKPRWDLATQYLTARIASADTVLVGDHMVNTQLALMNVGLAGARRTQSPDAAAAALARGGKVWAIYGRVGQGRMLSRDAFFARVADLGPPSVRVDVGNSILILGFESGATATVAPPGRRHGHRARHV